MVLKHTDSCPGEGRPGQFAALAGTMVVATWFGNIARFGPPPVRHPEAVSFEGTFCSSWSSASWTKWRGGRFRQSQACAAGYDRVPGPARASPRDGQFTAPE